jgi:ParB-like chromosome segregation protein Spo0J
MTEYQSTQDIPLNELDTFPGNARRGDVDKIMESLDTNGQYRALIVRPTGGRYTVLAGNHTLEAMKRLGRPFARCEIIACDEETARRINLVDNRLPDAGGYDDQALADLLRSLDGLDGTGYSPDDLDDLLAGLGETEEAEPGPTGARYAEDPEEEQARRERIESYEPRQTPAGGTAVELIVVMPVGDHQEATALIRSLRDRDGQELTAGQIVLRSLRAHSGVTEEEASDG